MKENINAMETKTKIHAFKYSDQISNIIMIVICGLLLVASVFLCAGSMASTTTLHLSEQVELVEDNVLKNIFVIGVFLVLLKLFKGFFKKINPMIAAVALLAYVGIFGAFWLSTANLTPIADSKVICDTAAGTVQNDFILLQDAYFKISPYQLGGVFICEFLTRIFGAGNYMAYAVLNIVWLDLAYAALIWITRVIFNKKGVELLTIVLLAGCLQPIFFCTLIYGNLMGLALSLWAVLFELFYLKTGKKKMMIISAALISVAILAKLNCAIVLIAMCVILVVHFIKSRKWFSLVAVACAVLMSVTVSGLVKLSYEARSGIRFGEGVPQLAWAVMGMQDEALEQANQEEEKQKGTEEDLALFPGWYNSYNIEVYLENDGDQEAMKAQVNRDLKERLDLFGSDSAYALTFFTNKALSQWNEPTFESLWVSERNGVLLSDFADEFYKGFYKNLLDIYFNFYVSLIFFGLAVGMLFIIKKPDMGITLLALIILGGFVYHLIFEAKSQYILPYFIMMVPFAAYGFYSLVHLKLPRRKALKR